MDSLTPAFRRAFSWYVLCYVQRVNLDEIKPMNVNAIENRSQTILQSGKEREKSQISFKAALDAAQEKPANNKKLPAQKSGRTAAEELAEYLRKTPAQHMRDAILKELGLTEEDLDAMPPEKRKAIEETITARVKERLLEQSGMPQNAGQSPLMSLSLLNNRQP